MGQTNESTPLNTEEEEGGVSLLEKIRREIASLEGYAYWAIGIGAGLAIFSPLVFTRSLGWLVLEDQESANIGAAIGGMTAPIVGFVSAILVYFSFKMQIKANILQINEIQRIQKDAQKVKEQDSIFDLMKDQVKVIEKQGNRMNEIFLEHISLLDKVRDQLRMRDFSFVADDYNQDFWELNGLFMPLIICGKKYEEKKIDKLTIDIVYTRFYLVNSKIFELYINFYSQYMLVLKTVQKNITQEEYRRKNSFSDLNLYHLGKAYNFLCKVQKVGNNISKPTNVSTFPN